MLIGFGLSNVRGVKKSFDSSDKWSERNVRV